MRTLLTSFVLAERLDEGLELLERYWSGQSITYHARHYRANDVALLPTPQQRPRPPIWIGGFWPNRRPMRRAARWDGAVPLFHSARHGYTPPVDEVRELADYVRSQHHPDRTTAPFELVVGGVSPSSQEHARDLLGPLIDAAGLKIRPVQRPRRCFVASRRGSADVRRVLDTLGVAVVRTRAIAPNHGTAGNANWHVWPKGGERCVLRRYHADTTPADLEYEHTIVTHLSRQGWCVPEPLDAPIEEGGRWYCLTRYVPGRRRMKESPHQSRQRGTDLARLHVALRPLAERIGQRPGWRPLRAGIPVMTPADWSAGLDQLHAKDPALATWAEVAAASTADELAGLGAAALPFTVIHGDFMAEQNVHYDRSHMAGVIDFGVAHLGSRPYELISARSYRAPELRTGYVDELRRHDWPWSDLEEAAIVPVRRAFHLGMLAWQLLDGMRTGQFDTAAIESQLARTGVDRSSAHP